MKATNTFMLVFLLFSSVLLSQTVSQQWVQRYNGNANSLDYGYAITTDFADNVIVTGFATNTASSKDLLTIKYDVNGNVIWSQQYDGLIHAGDYSFGLCTGPDGSVYVTGRTDGGATSADITTIKYSPAGAQEWVALYNGPGNGFDEARCVAVDNAGNVYVGGRSMGTTSDFDMTLIKYNPSGTQEWVQRYNGPGNGFDGINSIALDGSNNIYVAGESYGNGADYCVIKYDYSGLPLWNLRYNGPANGGDVAVSVKLDGASNVYVSGFSDGGSTGYDFATIQYDLNGNQQWLRRFSGVAAVNDFATAMAVDNSGNVVITGVTGTVISLIDSNYVTVKYNSAGVLQWSANYVGPNNSSDVPRAIVLDNDGNVYVTGSSFLPPDLDDYATIKYNSAGVQQWVMIYNGPANSNDYTSAIAVNTAGDVFVTGRSMGVGSSYDLATVKYALMTGIHQSGTQVPSVFNLYQNYPNPFNPETKIKFDIPAASDIRLSFFDITGKEVMEPVSNFLRAGTYEYVFDASKLSTGVYFYSLTTNSGKDTKKMVLTK